MKKKQSVLLSLIIFCLASLSGFAQTSNIVKSDMSQAEIDRIVQNFIKHEDEFRFALTNYVFNRSSTFQTIGMGGQITGTFRLDSLLTFNKQGKRMEKVLYAPVSTAKIQITREDLEDLGGITPFAINPRNFQDYSFSFIGKEKIDELNLYVFDVTPKINDFKNRRFKGRIWIDDRDLMIVKTKGKGVPEGKQRFPVVETWRTNVDGKYWFPAYSTSDDELVFDSGEVLKIRLRVKYTDYRMGRSDVRVIGEAEVVDEDTPPEDKK